MAFDRILFGVIGLGHLVGIDRVFVLQPGHGLSGQMAVMAEVAVGDEVPIRVGGSHSPPAPEQFFHFLGADPVVLVVVEDGKQDVEVLEQVLDLLLRRSAGPPGSGYHPSPRTSRRAVSQRRRRRSQAARRGGARRLRLPDTERLACTPRAESAYRPVPGAPCSGRSSPSRTSWLGRPT